MFWASLWIYNLALTITKVAILVQYIRIFPIRHFRCACYAVLCIVIACGAWGVFGNVFICYPIGFLWDRTVKDGRCMDDNIVWFTTAGLNIFQDVVILFMPIRVIRSLTITRSQKKGLITMFGLGARSATSFSTQEGSNSRKKQCHRNLNGPLIFSRQSLKLERSDFRQHRPGHTFWRRSQCRHHLRLSASNAAPLRHHATQVLRPRNRLYHSPCQRPRATKGIPNRLCQHPRRHTYPTHPTQLLPRRQQSEPSIPRQPPTHLRPEQPALAIPQRQLSAVPQPQRHALAQR
jgi:hypothetical protein